MAAIALNRVDPAGAKKAGAVSVVAGVLKEPDDQIASPAAGALRDFRSQPEVADPALVKALQHTNTLVACSAVWAIGASFRDGTNTFIPALRQAAQRKDNVGGWAKTTLELREAPTGPAGPAGSARE
jgi:hypothetical protein